MKQTLITIEQADLDTMYDRLDRIERMLKGVRMEPQPKWITQREYAGMIGKSLDTVKRHVKAQKVESKMTGDEVLVRNPQL